MLLNHDYTPKEQIIEALKTQSPLAVVAYDGDWGEIGYQVVNIVKHDPEDECFVTADDGYHPDDEIKLPRSAREMDAFAVEIAKRAMLYRLAEKRESKYPNAGWVNCDEDFLVNKAKEFLAENRLIDAMNMLGFAVALGYDY